MISTGTEWAGYLSLVTYIYVEHLNGMEFVFVDPTICYWIPKGQWATLEVGSSFPILISRGLVCYPGCDLILTLYSGYIKPTSPGLREWF